MGLRARSVVFWPGITMDVERRRQSCSDCVKNAPFQPSLQTRPLTPPSTPFEQTYANFFDNVGQHYLVVGCLISCLRNYFSRFGVVADCDVKKTIFLRAVTSWQQTSWQQSSKQLWSVDRAYSSRLNGRWGDVKKTIFLRAVTSWQQTSWQQSSEQASWQQSSEQLRSVDRAYSSRLEVQQMRWRKENDILTCSDELTASELTAIIDSSRRVDVVRTVDTCR